MNCQYCGTSTYVHDPECFVTGFYCAMLDFAGYREAIFEKKLVYKKPKLKANGEIWFYDPYKKKWSNHRTLGELKAKHIWKVYDIFHMKDAGLTRQQMSFIKSYNKAIWDGRY